ncbi:hypothetical protein BFW38_09935 [Terasakiispira papahanaumokuakeensis]|uniref:DUF2788 domain-containing protein n=1 Tax=Terasakiispira papahanaumokuakeensis TaxID=197479 RepID=A0A1E2VA13_9GAMM|nr:DUF2788 domain-containing protein [Terasakiispira papahanaumokuakeensis]ODC03814.1 hypothetical protein BFW38_09935 [Terasakiispira papahanaumokuakeensis]
MNYELNLLIDDYAMPVLIAIMIGFMVFIIWDLAKRSNAGKFGTLILFIALGLGILGFVIKSVVVTMMEGGFH